MGDVLNHLLFLPILLLQFLIHFQQRFRDCTDLIPSGDIQLGRLIILGGEAPSASLGKDSLPADEVGWL